MKQIDLAVAIPTINRSPKPNYLHLTLASISKSVKETCTDNVELFLVDNSPFSNVREYPKTEFPVRWRAFQFDAKPHIKIAQCLKIGHNYAHKWVLLLEDDVIVCRDFFGSVLRWLDNYPPSKYPDVSEVMTFGSAHPNIKLGLEAGYDGIRIPASEFYGTQAIAMRPETALDIARYLESSPRCKERPGEYDLAIVDWILKTQPDYPYIVASCPSFVQHIGRESSIREGGKFFEFDSFKGEDWTYEVKL